MVMLDSRRYLWNLYLINNVDDIALFKYLILIIHICFPGVEMRMPLFNEEQMVF